MTKSANEIPGRGTKTKPSDLDRRSFFKGATLGLGAGIAATALDAATGAPAEAATPELTTRSQYRLTDHVRRVYALARF